MRKLALLLCLCPGIALGQEADKGILVNWLQDNLSGAGRRVEIDGFQGALSSQASLERLTIADDQGIWLTLTGVTLDWSRSALLAGRVEVEALTAEAIELERLPDSQAETSPEAQPFALPDLPVSIEIDQVSAKRIRLGAAVLGQEVLASLEARLTLADGAGQGDFALLRAGDLGHVKLKASYANGDGALALDLDLAEAAGGIAATRLGVPGAPATALRIKGEGLVSDFTAEVKLTTDGVTRLGGLVTLKEGAFQAFLSGDPTPVFLPRYAAFFGPNLALQVSGATGPEGLRLDRLALQAAALTLEGKARFAPGGRPELLDVTGRLGLGPAVTLPLTTPVTVQGGTLRLYHDITLGADWRLESILTGLTTEGLTAREISLRAEGDLGEGVFDGTAEMSAQGLVPKDPALARALGQTLSASARFHSDETGFDIENLSLTAPGLVLTTLGRIDGEGRFDGKASGRIDDLTRLALYRPGISGALRFDLEGMAEALSGAFDLAGTLEGRGLVTGQPQADALLAGESRIAVSALRDAKGVTLRRLTAEAGGLTADLTGQVASTGSRLEGRLDLADLGPLRARGALSADLRAEGTLDTGRLQASLRGQDLGLGQVEIDRLLRGASTLTLDASVAGGKLRLEALDLVSAQLTARASGPVESLQIQARLANLGLFVPEFPGPLAMTGKLGWQEGAVLDLALRGPGQIAATVAGRLGSALTIKGTAAAALANPFLRPRSVSGGLRFDLVLRDMALPGLSGTVQLTQGRLSDPGLPFGLAETTASVQLSGGIARVTSAAQISTGGAVEARGSVRLAAPYAADLVLRLDKVLLRDPQLYETSLGGEMTFRGPALGGAVVAGALSLGRTELRIPSTLGPAAVLDVTHRGDGPAVRTTRARAQGDEAAQNSGGGPGYRLDLRITAPNQVFLRGRGLDAELGGGLTLKGTSSAIVPQGGFSLLRGRMDILGRRLTLSEANLDLQGALVPMVFVVASVEAADITATVTVDGPATAPEVRFTSSPALPQEEVLAQLLFGRGLETMSAFQAAQLASAVATLAGRGGEGILGKIRSKTGLDNLDIQTNGSGGGSLTAGKYLSEKIYSEVTLDSEGKSEVSLNFDVARHITLKAKVDTEGNSGAGVFLKKDY